jgi:hypothetical protein
MKWFRFWNDTINDVKILQLSDYEYRIWTYLLSYASATDSLSGHFQITFKLLSLHFHQRFNLFSRAIETFQRVGLITVDEDGYITITNWNKRQFASDNAYERVKKHREVTLKRNVSVTAPEADTETDTDKKKKKTPPRKKLTDEEWIESLKSNPAYIGLDIQVIKGKCEAWCFNKGKMFTRARLLNWLNREERPMGGDGNGSGAYRRPGASFEKAGRGKDDGARGDRLPKEYIPETLPDITEEERQRNLERLKELTG